MKSCCSVVPLAFDVPPALTRTVVTPLKPFVIIMRGVDIFYRLAYSIIGCANYIM